MARGRGIGGLLERAKAKIAAGDRPGAWAALEDAAALGRPEPELSALLDAFMELAAAWTSGPGAFGERLSRSRRCYARAIELGRGSFSDVPGRAASCLFHLSVPEAKDEADRWIARMTDLGRAKTAGDFYQAACFLERFEEGPEKRKTERMLAALDRSIAEAPHGKAFWMRAYLRQGAGDLDGALEDYGLAAALLPGEARVLMGRSLARALGGDRAGGLADFEAAFAASPRASWPSLAPNVAALARGLLDAGLAGDAAEVLEKTLARVSPEETDQAMGLMNLLEEAGKWKRE